MLLPLSDQPNPKGIPWVNYTLIGINLLVFLLVSLPLGFRPPAADDPDLPEYVRVVSRQFGREPGLERRVLASVSAYDLFVFRHGFRPARPGGLDLLTSMFLHAGWLHLLGNMLFLWIYGDNVEYRLGRAAYLLAYLGTGAAATGLHALLQPGSELPTIGASGAISGVLGFYFVWFPRNQVRVLLFLFPFLSQIVVMPARWVLGIYLVLDNLLPLLFLRGAAGGVAYGAHIGGFLAGLGGAFLIRAREAVRRPPVIPGGEPAGPAGGEAIPVLLREGDPDRAVSTYTGLSRAQARRLVDPRDLLRLAGHLRETGRADGALFLYQRLLADYPRSDIRAAAHLGAGLVQFYGRRQPTAAYQHFLAALDLDPPAPIACRAREEIGRIRHLQKLQIRGFPG